MLPPASNWVHGRGWHAFVAPSDSDRSHPTGATKAWHPAKYLPPHAPPCDNAILAVLLHGGDSMFRPSIAALVFACGLCASPVVRAADRPPVPTGSPPTRRPL